MFSPHHEESVFLILFIVKLCSFGCSNDFIEKEQQFNLMFYHFQIFFSLYYFNNLVCIYILLIRDRIFFSVQETCGNSPAGHSLIHPKQKFWMSDLFLSSFSIFPEAIFPAKSSSSLASFWAHFMP